MKFSFVHQHGVPAEMVSQYPPELPVGDSSLAEVVNKSNVLFRDSRDFPILIKEARQKLPNQSVVIRSTLFLSKKAVLRELVTSNFRSVKVWRSLSVGFFNQEINNAKTVKTACFL